MTKCEDTTTTVTRTGQVPCEALGMPISFNLPATGLRC